MFYPNLIQVYNGYKMIDAEPPKYRVVRGDGKSKVPPFTWIWLMEHGATGWYYIHELLPNDFAKSLHIMQEKDVYAILVGSKFEQEYEN